MCTWNRTWFFKVDWTFLNFKKMCQNQKPHDLKIWRTRFKLAPSSRWKKLLSKSRSKVLFKKKNKPTLVQINVEFLWENKRNPCWLSSWVYTHLTNIKGENEGGRGCFLSRNTEQDQPIKEDWCDVQWERWKCLTWCQFYPSWWSEHNLCDRFRIQEERRHNKKFIGS